MRVRGALLLALAAACAPPSVAPTPLSTGVAGDVAYLASDKLGGRETGTTGSTYAAEFIAKHYERLGLSGAFHDACAARTPCPQDWFQSFSVRGGEARNIAVIIPGTDSTLRGQYVVVGAHYDHLGRAPLPSTGFVSARGASERRRATRADDPYERDAGLIRPGADDNASGTAAVMELGRRLVAAPARMSVLLVHFDAEELGMIGSSEFVDHPPVPKTSMVMMINLDMIGRLRGVMLIVDTSAARGAFGTLVSAAATAEGLATVYSSAETADRSDHASFGRVGIPAVALFTGMHDDYHRASDVAERINVPGIWQVVDIVEMMVRALPVRR